MGSQQQHRRDKGRRDKHKKIGKMDPYSPTRHNKGQAAQSAERQNRIGVDAGTTSCARLATGNPKVAGRLATGNLERSKAIFHRNRQLD
jgi:hypothetical protein